jgi:hypothetical protein
MWTWWRNATLIVALALGVQSAVAQTDATPSEGVPSDDPGALAPADVIDLEPITLQPGLDARQAKLRAHEARLRLWESDLTRRAKGERYFRDLEGYVTPDQLSRAFLLGMLLSCGLTLVVIRVLARMGVWRVDNARSRQELKRLETRVLTGLREFDGLLTRLYDRLQRDIVKGDAKAEATSTAPGRASNPTLPLEFAVAAATAGSDGGSTSSARSRVVSLAREGLEREEIGRQLDLGPAEVDLILRLEASR